MGDKEAGEKSNDPWRGQTHLEVDSKPDLAMSLINWDYKDEGIESVHIESRAVAEHIRAVELSSETNRELVGAILKREGVMRVIASSLLRIFLATALIYIALTAIAMFFPVASVEPLARLERLLVIEAGLLGSAYWWKHHRNQDQS